MDYPYLVLMCDKWLQYIDNQMLWFEHDEYNVMYLANERREFVKLRAEAAAVVARWQT